MFDRKAFMQLIFLCFVFEALGSNPKKICNYSTLLHTLVSYLSVNKKNLQIGRGLVAII